MLFQPCAAAFLRVRKAANHLSQKFHLISPLQLREREKGCFSRRSWGAVEVCAQGESLEAIS